MVETDVSSSDPESDLPTNYVDSNGVEHSILPVCSFARISGINTISGGIITDRRTITKSLGDFLMLDCSNSPLTGPLRLASTLRVTGNVILDSDLVMNTGTLSGDNASIDFALGNITATELAVSNIIVSSLNTAFLGTECIYFPTSDSARFLLNIGDDSDLQIVNVDDSSFAQLKVGTPRLDSHAVDKKTFDYGIASHNHNQYLSQSTLEAMQAILTPTQAVALAIARPGTSALLPSEYIDWVHGLGSIFVLVQVRVSAAGVAPWLEDPAVIKYDIQDANTVRITNASVASVDASRLYVVAFSAIMTKTLDISDGIALDAIRESVET